MGQIRSLIKADIAPGGPKAKDRNPFACFSDQGYFGRTYNDQTIALPDHLERYCLHTPTSLDAHRLDPSQPLVLRPTNTSSFRGVIQMVNYLVRKGIGIATPQLRSRLEALKDATGRVRPPAPRFIPTTAELEVWLDRGEPELMVSEGLRQEGHTVLLAPLEGDAAVRLTVRTVPNGSVGDA